MESERSSAFANACSSCLIFSVIDLTWSVSLWAWAIRTLFPLVAARVPLGQIAEHPRRTHDWQGNVLSHFSLDLRHSAQERPTFLLPLAVLSAPGVLALPSAAALILGEG